MRWFNGYDRYERSWQKVGRELTSERDRSNHYESQVKQPSPKTEHGASHKGGLTNMHSNGYLDARYAMLKYPDNSETKLSS